MQHLPLQHLEMQLMAPKEMHTAMYELCRKTRFVQRVDIVFMLHATAFVLVNHLVLLLH